VKKTIWQPLVLGVVLGLLAGIATVTGLSFLASSFDTNAVIGIYAPLLLLAAALGGPLAGAIASTMLVIISTLFGPPDLQEVLREPAVFWSNVLAVGTVVVLVGIAYRLVFERVGMPARLLAWAGIVIAYYFIQVPASITPQRLLLGESGLIPAILFTYKSFIPQAIFDIFITSLVFIALPSSYRRPLWYKV
jgi:hypothetical protein